MTAGELGHIFVVAAFCASFVAAYSYFFSAKNPLVTSWKTIGRISFFIQASSVVAIFSVLFYLIFTHQYQYHYVWEHSGNTLPVHYMIACFWEGQEGSFLLWMFWQSLIGIILIAVIRDWESPVLSVIALCQTVLASMILGVYVFGIKIGSSPFILLRDAMPEAPIFQSNPDFVPADGRGLNPLLQNYWMVIHPPTLFLGFASTIVPFAFSIAGMWRRRYAEWICPAMPWTIFSVMILGTGIIMGGYWAYVTLSFGGYWNWDPVENSSLIPWLVAIASLHTMLIYKNRGTSLKLTSVLCVLIFLLVLYSTFLTRSGILGDISVHSFTDLGLSGQLFIFLFLFLIASVVIFSVHLPKMPRANSETQTLSREFFLFAGALVLCLSALQVLFGTSSPVIGKIFHSSIAPPSPRFYSNWNLSFAVFIAILSGVGQYFWWRNMDKKTLSRILLPPFALSAVTTSLVLFLRGITDWQYAVLFLSASFSFFANGIILLKILRGNYKLSGGSLAHIGFALMLIGILFSSGYSEVVSINPNEKELGEDFPEAQRADNILLWKGETKRIGDFMATYRGEKQDGIRTMYEVEFTDADDKKFTLYPEAEINPKMGLIAHPAIKNFPARDIYVHVSSIPDPQNNSQNAEPQYFSLGIGDTASMKNALIVFEDLKPLENKEGYDISVAARLKVIDLKNEYYVEPVYHITSNTHLVEFETTELPELNMKFAFTEINPEQKKIGIVVQEGPKPEREFIVIQAIQKPFINFLWLGTGVLIIGFLVAIFRRVREFKLSD